MSKTLKFVNRVWGAAGVGFCWALKSDNFWWKVITGLIVFYFLMVGDSHFEQEVTDDK